jgi:Phage tail lysozyme
MFDMPPVAAGFDARAGWLVNRLIADLPPLTLNQAAAIPGNLGGESGLEAVQERHPRGGRGGFGWCQWTGSAPPDGRRFLFEHWCADHDLDAASDEANYGFLVEELRTTQAHALEQLRKTTTLEAAVYTFEAIFERPADLQSGLPDRIAFAKRALAASVGAPHPAPAPTPATPASSADELNQEELLHLLGQSIAEHQARIAPPPAMPASRPVHTTIASAGLAASVVVSAVWGLSLAEIAVPDNVQNAWIVILTALGAGLLHWRPGFAAVLPSSQPQTRKS